MKQPKQVLFLPSDIIFLGYMCLCQRRRHIHFALQQFHVLSSSSYAGITAEMTGRCLLSILFVYSLFTAVAQSAAESSLLSADGYSAASISFSSANQNRLAEETRPIFNHFIDII